MSFILSFFGKAAAFATLGPVGSVLSVVWTGFKMVVSWVWQGLELCITHPVAWLIVGIGFFAGVHYGKAWDAHLVAKAKTETQTIVSKVQGAADVEKAKAEAAIRARDAAK